MKRLQTWRVKNQQRAPAQTKCCKLKQSFPKMPNIDSTVLIFKMGRVIGVQCVALLGRAGNVACQNRHCWSSCECS